MRILVAGVPVDAVRLKEAALRAAAFLSQRRSHMIVTPNPEMAVLAARDPGFKKILESSDLALADGYGLRLAAWWEKKHIPETLTGVDFVLVLAELAEQKNCSAFFLGAEEGIAEKAARNIQQVYPRLRIAGAASGGKIRWIDGRWQEDPNLAESINVTQPDILIVALGHGKQERWMRDHLPQLPSVKIAIGVGGALDYYAGQVKRAPVFLQKFHLEWLWRLVTQPWRAWRVFEATAVFLKMVLKSPRNTIK